MKRALTLVIFLLLIARVGTQAEGVDDDYVRIYNLILEADAMNESGQGRQAASKYLEAQTSLKNLQTTYPGWNEKVVNYRLAYVASKLEPLTQERGTAHASPGVARKGTIPGGAPGTNQVQAWQDEVARLSERNALLEAKLKEAFSVQPAATDPRELGKAEERIRLLEKENDLLKVSLQEGQSARARVEAYEAKAVPYTPEEQAVFKQPPPRESAADPTPAKKKALELPAGAGPLIAQAQRAIDSGRFDEAEKKYLQVLRQDEKNVYTLANLAAVQLDQNRLGDAEKTLKQALAVDPQDAPSLYLMGSLRFRQEKYDEALEALSLSARIDPERPQTQYFLGKTFIQKGSRGPAETALRKAVQLRPGWGEAHYLLAVVYATQKPPYKELAQWHYQKAVAGGTPRNVELEKWIEDRKSTSASP